MNTEEIDFTNAEMLRQKAEEIIKTKQLDDNILQKEIDAQKLLHELQVHQIELEMQNQELRHAYDNAETALKRYTRMFDLSPIGYFILDQEGSILNLNFTGADTLGERRFSLINSNFKLFIADKSKRVFTDFLKRAYKSYTKEFCEVVIGTKKEASRPIYIEGVVSEDDQECLLSVIDISSFTK